MTNKQLTLKWVNQIRMRLGLETLGELPRGRRHSALDCVIARGIENRASVGQYVVSYERDVVEAAAGAYREITGKVTEVVETKKAVASRQLYSTEVPAAVFSFIGYFDLGAYPELESTLPEMELAKVSPEMKALAEDALKKLALSVQEKELIAS